MARFPRPIRARVTRVVKNEARGWWNGSRDKAAAAILLVMMSTPLAAQWLNHRDPRIPRLRDGKPNLSAPTPHASNGRPDLSGVWQAEPTSSDEMKRLFGAVNALSVPGDDVLTFSKHFLNLLVDCKPDESPLRPAMLDGASRTTKKPTSPVGFTVLKLCSTRTGRHHCTDTTLRPVGATGAFVAAFIVLVAIFATVMIVPCRSPVSWTVFPAFATRSFWSWLAMV